MDIAKAAKADGTIASKAAAGMLDRPLFVAFYTAQSLAYGGMLTWALSGQAPQKLLDYIYPKSGEKNPDGTDARLNTMFYAREFAAAYKHMQTEGVVAGTTQFFLNKASPVVGMVKDWAKNVDYFGKEISDPEAPAYIRLAQKLSHVMQELEPMSISSVKRSSTDTVKSYALSIAGFGPAPKYATETPTEMAIKSAFRKYHGTSITPYEKAEYGDEAKKLKKAYAAGDTEEYGKQLLAMKEKYNLTPRQIQSMRKSAGVDPTLKMFKALSPKQQKEILKQMPEEERLKYLRYASPQVRYHYAEETQ
jgi:hypothetical protein